MPTLQLYDRHYSIHAVAAMYPQSTHEKVPQLAMATMVLHYMNPSLVICCESAHFLYIIFVLQHIKVFADQVNSEFVFDEKNFSFSFK